VFTGLVEAIGTVRGVEAAGEKVRLRVDLGPVAAGARAGDSIAVDGTCLTLVAAPVGTEGAFDCVRETLDRTALGRLAPGVRVNLEGALRVGDRLGGHFVQGHVDGLGRVRGNGGPDGGWVLSVAAPPEVRPYLVPKGSVAVAGVSLTLASVDPEGFTVALVPHTLDATTLRGLVAGDPVNLEADVLAKWVRHLLEAGGAPATTITREWLKEQGFGG
jgi:riboflavin synthase